MKITDIRWTPAFIPIEAPLRYAFGSHPGFSRIIIEVDTDEGITGLGE
jgi:glucarate dehydratase